ncbi:MAG: hypothetical protein KGS72_27145 [Cyanobacteria bacterium REEB67]|nr:hypothetical protein [Cyanobacteria bacterium REEB67]
MQNSATSLRPCDVWGELTLTSDIGEILVTAENDRVSVVLPSLYEARFSQISEAFDLHHNVVRLAHQICRTMDVQVVILLSGREIAVLGRGSIPGLISKSLSIDPLQIKLFPLLAALLDDKAAQIKRKLSRGS